MEKKITNVETTGRDLVVPKEYRGEIVEAKPVEPEPTGEVVNFDNRFDMSALLKTAGKLSVTDEQKGILRAPLTPEQIEIRPDGLIYLPWVEYQDRLDKAFGTEWTMVPNGMPMYDKASGQIVWGFYLVVKGCLVDFAIGGQEYQPGNRGLNYSDAIEGCKSNALMRLCKRLGIGLEMWRPSFVRDWKEKHAETYQKEVWGGGKKTMWRRKEAK